MAAHIAARGVLARLLVSIGLIAAVAPHASATDAGLQAFYTVAASDIEGKPGSIIRVEPWNLHTLYRAKFYRILYRSTGLNGKPIAVSGAVIVPEVRPWPGGRPIVAWAHPTTGVVRHCAPTLDESPLDDIPGIANLIAEGYVIAATDYPGLGTAGPHPYLIGVSEGRAVLDSVRAARELAAAEASNRFVVWGHSQGGHAALFAGELAGHYAPELRLEGVAAAAPATELAELFDEDYTSVAGKILASMALVSWSEVFNVPLQSVVAAVKEVKAAGAGCVDTVGSALDELEREQRIPKGYLKADPAKVQPWSSLMAKNTPGRSPAGAPVFVAQGTADKIVHPATTEEFVNGLCGRGEAVTFVKFQGVDHGLISHKAAAKTLAWIDDRFRGVAAPRTCR
jgi:acetyl esterase/lipase